MDFLKEGNFFTGSHGPAAKLRKRNKKGLLDPCFTSALDMTVKIISGGFYGNNLAAAVPRHLRSVKQIAGNVTRTYD